MAKITRGEVTPLHTTTVTTRRGGWDFVREAAHRLRRPSRGCRRRGQRRRRGRAASAGWRRRAPPALRPRSRRHSSAPPAPRRRCRATSLPPRPSSARCGGERVPRPPRRAWWPRPQRGGLVASHGKGSGIGSLRRLAL